MSASILALPARIYTPSEAARLTGIPRTDVRRAIARGCPFNFNIRGRYATQPSKLVDLTELRQWYRSRPRRAYRRRWVCSGVDTRPGIIYALKCPDTRRVRYVGKTGQALNDRLRCYRHDARQEHKATHSPCLRWWRKLAREGKEPIAVVLQECLPGTLDACEQEWIARGKSKRWKLLNVEDGGQGGGWNTEHRRKHSERCGETNRRLAQSPHWIAAQERKCAATKGMTVERWREWKREQQTRREWNRLLRKYQCVAAEWRRRQQVPKRQKRKIRIEGDVAYVPLTGGMVAVVDADDAQRIADHQWSANYRHGRNTIRVKANINGKTALLARFVMRCDRGVVKRASGHALDYRKQCFTVSPANTSG